MYLPHHRTLWCMQLMYMCSSQTMDRAQNLYISSLAEWKGHSWKDELWVLVTLKRDMCLFLQFSAAFRSQLMHGSAAWTALWDLEYMTQLSVSLSFIFHFEVKTTFRTLELKTWFFSDWKHKSKCIGLAVKHRYNLWRSMTSYPVELC